MSSIHDNSPHANENIVINRASMEYGPMTNSHFVANVHANTCGNMNSHIVLNIRSLANFDLSQIATQNGIVEHRRIITDANIAHKACTFG